MGTVSSKKKQISQGKTNAARKNAADSGVLFAALRMLFRAYPG